jgi:hypothetical protein
LFVAGADEGRRVMSQGTDAFIDRMFGVSKGRAGIGWQSSHDHIALMTGQQ